MDGKGTFFEACLLPTHKSGRISIENNRLIAQNCREVTLMIYAATSYNGVHKSPSKEGKNPHKAILNHREMNRGKEYGKLKKEHIDDYQFLFNRVSFKLPANKAYQNMPTDERLKRFKDQEDQMLVTNYFNSDVI